MKFDFYVALKNAGIEIGNTGYYQNRKFIFRMIASGDIQVAFRWGFDRWANSTDFVFSLPKTQKRFDEIMLKLNEAQKASKWAVSQEIRI